MFTGLIASVGKVKSVASHNGTRRITIEAPTIAPQLRLGDSVAVNGVCLTALDVTSGSFSADLAQETVARTSLTRLSSETPVNLELPMRADAPLGGHVVQGHVDGIGKLLSLDRLPEGDDWKLQVELPAGLEAYVVHKGSVAIEGISLTVASIEGPIVTVAIIPHTYQATNLNALKPGDPVNIEVDVLAKYAEKMQSAKAGSGVTAERLLSEGF